MNRHHAYSAKAGAETVGWPIGAESINEVAIGGGDDAVAIEKKILMLEAPMLKAG